MGKLSVIAILLSTIALAQGQDCPPNSFYVDEYGACIHPDNDVSPMGYADLYCQAFGGHLLSIHSHSTNALITGIQLTSLTQKRGFLGLRKAANGTYLWSDGTPNNYTNWGTGQPSRGDCVSLDSDDKTWKSVDCDSNLPYLCAWPAITPPNCNSTPPPPISCPRSSTYVDEIQSCLHTNNNLVSFVLAEKYCQAFNGHLFSIHDLDTDSFLTGVSYTQISRSYFYIGARRMGGQFAWVDQSPWDYQNWNPGEPRLDCGSIEKKTANWTSVDCTTALPFMCNIPAILNGGCPTSTPPTTTEPSMESEGITATTESVFPPTMSPLTCSPPSLQDLYSCYNGWQYFPTTDSSYLVGFNLSYTPAEAYCQSQNAHLASVHSASESSFIGGLCCATDCTHRSFGDYAGGFIVGAKKQNQNWVWSDGTPFDYQPSICPETQGYILWILSDTCGDCKGPGDWDYTDTDDAVGVPYFVCKRSGFVAGAVVRELSQIESHHSSRARSTRISSVKSPQPKKK